MKSAAILSLFILGLATHSVLAQEVNTGLTGGSAMDMLNQTNVPPAITQIQDDQHVKVKVRGTCTDTRGRNFNSTDAGYDACMRLAGEKVEHKGAARKGSQIGADPGGNTSFNIGE